MPPAPLCDFAHIIHSLSASAPHCRTTPGATFCGVVTGLDAVTVVVASKCREFQPVRRIEHRYLSFPSTGEQERTPHCTFELPGGPSRGLNCRNIGRVIVRHLGMPRTGEAPPGTTTAARRRGGVQQGRSCRREATLAEWRQSRCRSLEKERFEGNSHSGKIDDHKKGAIRIRKS